MIRARGPIGGRFRATHTHIHPPKKTWQNHAIVCNPKPSEVRETRKPWFLNVQRPQVTQLSHTHTHANTPGPTNGHQRGVRLPLDCAIYCHRSAGRVSMHRWTVVQNRAARCCCCCSSSLLRFANPIDCDSHRAANARDLRRATEKFLPSRLFNIGRQTRQRSCARRMLLIDCAERTFSGSIFRHRRPAERTAGLCERDLVFPSVRAGTNFERFVEFVLEALLLLYTDGG